jgi:hypothetical protein
MVFRQIIKRRLPMHIGTGIAFALATLAFHNAVAAGPDFSGTWTIDLRTASDRKRGAECGNARFVLTQTGDKIVGDHSMYPTGCGRINEGGEETVKGIVVGSTAVLVVTSGRNGAVVMGVARLSGARLRWKIVEEIKPGEPPADSPLILGNGVLTKDGAANAK